MQYNMDNNSYNYFKGIISSWINSRGEAASTSELDNALRSIRWNAPADDIRDNWFTNARRASELREVSSSHSGPRRPIWFNMRDPVPLYTGREDMFKEVHNMFFPAEAKNVLETTQVALVGSCGVGKSEFARQFIKLHHVDFDSNIVWINAENFQLVEESFKKLAKNIGVELAETINKEQILEMIKRVYEYFGDQKSLFVFDNIESWRDEENTLNDYLPEGIAPFIRRPCILMTSRCQPIRKTYSTIEVVELSVLEEKDAIELLESFLKTNNLELTSQLAKMLDFLPLALHQAISYIQREVDLGVCSEDEQVVVKTECVKSYICKFDTEWKKLLDYGDAFDELQGSRKTLVSWKMTLIIIKDASPTAIKLLTMMSCIASENIHLDMFETRFRKDDLDMAVKLLLQYSMLFLVGPKIVNIHRLVQKVMRSDGQESALEEMLAFLSKFIIDLPKSVTPYTKACINHAQVLWEHALPFQKLIKQFKDYPVHLCQGGDRHQMYQQNFSLLEKTILKYVEHQVCKCSSSQYICIQNLMGQALVGLEKYEDAKCLFRDIYKTAVDELGYSNQLTQDILQNLTNAQKEEIKSAMVA